MKKAVFCINSGRVGSEYLAKLLDSGANCVGFHEPEPRMINVYTRMVDFLPYHRTRIIRRKKAKAIQKYLAGMNEHIDVYAETTNMFIKTFFDVIMDSLENVEVIFLRRKLVEVVKSFVDLGYFLPWKKGAKKWLTSPNSTTAAIEPIGVVKDLDQYDQVISYLIDIEARGMRFVKSYPQSTIYHVNVERLNRVDYVKELFSLMGIIFTDGTCDLLGQRFNIRDVKKERASSLDYCQQRIDLYIERAIKKGIEVPESLYL